MNKKTSEKPKTKPAAKPALKDSVKPEPKKQAKPAAKKPQKSPKADKRPEYTHVMILFSLVFILLIGYLIKFQVKDAREAINNPFNARLAAFENRVIRGSIESSDGDVLAYTKVSEDGSEKRMYPYGCTFSQVLGYADNGRSGIEKLANFQLVQSNAYFLERFVNEIKEKKNTGDTVITTLNSKLQTVAHDALSTHKGAVVVLDVKTGDVLAMVSKPDYDPGQVKAQWGELNSSSDGILLNRALQGLYPPGSTFKTITLLTYLRNHSTNADSFSFNCTGKVNVGNSSISCYHGSKHGELNMERAFAKSCNSAFADIGRNLDTSSLRRTSEQLLFNQKLPIDMPYSMSSFKLKKTDSEAIRMMTAIGQGDTMVTPMHMALITSAVANKGLLMNPRFLLRTENYTGTLVEKYPASDYGTLLTGQEAQIIEDYMRAVVEEGTGSALKSSVYEAYGKTGTAEYSSNKSKSHAWFTGYVKGEKDTIAICVLVEGAGSGSEFAVPIAKKVFDAYYE